MHFSNDLSGACGRVGLMSALKPLVRWSCPNRLDSYLSWCVILFVLLWTTMNYRELVRARDAEAEARSEAEAAINRQAEMDSVLEFLEKNVFAVARQDCTFREILSHHQ